jgi:hypothetical protein
MAKNLGREYASMTEDERREFELKRAQDRELGPGGDEWAEELDLDDPRRYPSTRRDVPSDAREGQSG